MEKIKLKIADLREKIPDCSSKLKEKMPSLSLPKVKLPALPKFAFLKLPKC